MPRLATHLVRHARSRHPYLPLLLRTTRDLPSAICELRWLREHVRSQLIPPDRARLKLWNLVKARSRAVPLQYLLGTEHFGDLEIAVAKGVLIPRWETAEAVSELVRRFVAARASEKAGIGGDDERRRVKILDLCTGSGCSALLARHEFLRHGIQSEVLGIDISSRAIGLAKRNLRRLVPRHERASVVFARADVLADSHISTSTSTTDAAPSITSYLSETAINSVFDIVLANPPYISRESYNSSSTARSVRLYEPRLALVPPSQSQSSNDLVPADGDGDVFYPSILRIAGAVSAKLVLMECADLAQAERVARLCGESEWSEVEVWRDEPAGVRDEGENEVGELGVEVRGRKGMVCVRGRGEGRSVVCWR
ncbi:MAG: hypothetical protein M1828_002819 [Chrysothrix sp. TS-e1954]|nr:MAG: hypothetical protein M1828_002819 [Chrysothrix sp. TS-e1954]